MYRNVLRLQKLSHPDVKLASERLSDIEVDHFRWSVRQGGVFSDLFLNDSDPLLLRVQDLGRRRAEITENVKTLARSKNVFNLFEQIQYRISSDITVANSLCSAPIRLLASIRQIINNFDSRHTKFINHSNNAVDIRLKQRYRFMYTKKFDRNLYSLTILKIVIVYNWKENGNSTSSKTLSRKIVYYKN